MEAACSDLGDGLRVCFNVTPVFLIRVSCSQTGIWVEAVLNPSLSVGIPSENSLKFQEELFLPPFFFLKQLLFFELQGLTAALVLLGDFFTMWINQCYELGPWGFGNVIGFR